MSKHREQKHYIAFISYSTTDEKWAKWLWHKLEYYYVPSNLRKEHPELPKHLRPVFWYKQDLSGTGLENALHKELDASGYLIVICSPSSAKSDWVNKEVLRFVELGRQDKIIPLIVAGSPNARNANEECFPPALRNLPKEQELRGIDVRRKEGKQHALVDVIATLLGVRFNDLWQRHKRHRKKIIKIITSILLLLFLSGLAQMEYKRPRIEYYADYVDTWGVPTGVLPLDKDTRMHRYRSYQFTYQRTPLSEPNALKWRLAKVCYVNSKDVPQDHEDLEFVLRSAIMELSYSKQTGYLSKIQYRTAEGLVTHRQDISTYNSVFAAIADFKASTDDLGSGYAKANTTSFEKKGSSSIKRFAYERDANGYITSLTFHSNNDDDLQRSIICDANGIYGMRFERDSLGRTLQIEYMDERGNITTTKRGVAGHRYTYDTHGTINSYIFFDIQKRPILNDYNWAQCVERTDAYGNVYWGGYYDENNQLCVNSLGYAQHTYQYDEMGNNTAEVYLGVDSLPCIGVDGTAGWVAIYDENCYCVQEHYVDTAGNLCAPLMDGVPMNRYKYNSQGKCTEKSCYNVDGKPMPGEFGFSKIQWKYDRRGNCVQVSYFDTMGQPYMFFDQFSTIKRKYDSYGNCIEDAYYDDKGKMCSVDQSNVTSSRSKYNSAGQLIELTHHDAHGNLARMANNVARMVFQYDTRGNLSMKAHYGPDGKLCFDTDSIAKIKWVCDSYGNFAEKTYFDTNDKPYMYQGNFATLRQKFDQNGNHIERAYYDEKGKLVCNKKGYAVQKLKYDQRGNCVEVRNYDPNGALCLDKQGVAVYNYTYDKWGNCLHEAFYGIDNTPVVNQQGYAKAIYTYDIHNHRIEATYYDVKGGPISLEQ